MLYFQFGLYQDITVGLQNCKVLVVCVSDEVSGSKLLYEYNRIGGVLASSAVDRGFERRSGQTKDYKIGICCFSTRHAACCSSKKQTSSSHGKLTCSRHDIVEKLLSWC